MALTIHYILDAEPPSVTTALTLSDQLMNLAQAAERAGLEAAANQINALAMSIFGGAQIRALAI